MGRHRNSKVYGVICLKCLQRVRMSNVATRRSHPKCCAFSRMIDRKSRRTSMDVAT
jgi:hypothetical protein